MTERRRPHDRAAEALRPLRLEAGAMKFAEGSARIELGDTVVLVSASVENRVPFFLNDQGRGWVTAEYAMLPRATPTRSTREVTRGRPSGRSSEIQRLVGRSLRAAFDATALGERTITLDCDVLQADGGTRTAAITAAWVALYEACAKLLLMGDIERWPLPIPVAAVSAGIVQGRRLLDLEYVEDSVADVDMNVVATADGNLIEVQSSGEGATFRRQDLDDLLDLALGGIERLAAAQLEAVSDLTLEVDAALAKSRRPAPAKAEKDLWGPP